MWFYFDSHSSYRSNHDSLKLKFLFIFLRKLKLPLILCSNSDMKPFIPSPTASLAFLVLLAGIFASVSGCTKPVPTPSSDPQADLVNKGRKAYVSHCIACHNIDPRKDGSIGPALFGSSLELLELKVLKGEYPVGHQPKRQTAAMAPLPFAKDNLPAIHAFLNSN